MSYEDLVRFIEHDMRMAHVYQPVMLHALLAQNGRASRENIARALLNQDRSQLEYYSEITKNMVGRVLTNRGVVTRDGSDYVLLGFDALTSEQVEQLKRLCNAKLAEYVGRRGDAIWQHRRRSAGYISGTLRYDVLKNAKFRCELCGVPADEKALEIDHIIPRNKGGSDEIFNLQALCYSCNAMKRDRDDTDFRAVRAAYERSVSECPFCTISHEEMLLKNSLAFVIRDRYPVTHRHVLIIPKRHSPDYFDLGTAELSACQQLLAEGRKLLVREDPSIRGFNVGINSGEVAGQTVMHSHIHLIPRRAGDSDNPRGGVRCVIQGKANYEVNGGTHESFARPFD